MTFETPDGEPAFGDDGFAGASGRVVTDDSA
jgi:hypothetical protein